MSKVGHLQDFGVIEFRRYTIEPGHRQNFARYFENYFPEAMQQSGAILFGHFLARDELSGFVWLRGFHTMEDRGKLNQEFYSGPVWREHSATMNEHMLDHTNVLLLQPLSPAQAIPVLPSVDPIAEPDGAQGLAVAQIFRLKTGETKNFAEQAESIFASYRAVRAHEAGVLVTLDAPNNFPALPFRTDGPYLVWLGLVQNEQALETGLKPAVEAALPAFAATGLLQDTPELLVLNPTHRSRLRWLPKDYLEPISVGADGIRPLD